MRITSKEGLRDGFLRESMISAASAAITPAGDDAKIATDSPTIADQHRGNRMLDCSGIGTKKPRYSGNVKA